MPVFDFNNDTSGREEPECTYTTYRSSEPEASAEKPILLLDNRDQEWKHHSCGTFASPNKRTAFEFREGDETLSADILQIDARFVSLIRWLGEHRIPVRLSGKKTGRTVMRSTGSGRPLLAEARSSQPRMDSFSL